ncbi:MAG: hypothetical protein OXG23_04875 [Chloroflexi bacterium]|nr:hypothetical protein [Chloroflexota bacterium]
MSRENRKLCLSLLNAESENAVIRLLKHYGYWSNDSLWRAYGDKENNFGQIGSQQGQPAGAMIEKLVNSIDAVLMRECLGRGIPVEGSDAPQSIDEALERFFDIRNGNLANIGAANRTKLSRNIGLVATGSKSKPNYTVFDRGEGQTPRSMPETILSLSESNKLRIPFVQGEFNMGGSGALPFCGGEHNLQLVISRRYPEIANGNDPTSSFWGFTIVRRQDPADGESHSIYKYLAPNGEILTYESESLSLPHGSADVRHTPTLEWGTVIKMYEYEMTGLKTSINFRLFYVVSLLLPSPGLPVRFYEFRDYKQDGPEATMPGLHVRLEEAKGGNLEDGFPVPHQTRVLGEKLSIKIFAFKKGRDESYRRNEGLIFTINGQTHHTISKDFFSRRKVNMSYIDDSVLVVVNANNVSKRAREKLFMTSRDRTRRGELYTAIERRLEEIIRNEPKLKELRDRRRREALEDKLSDSKPLKEVLNNIIRKSPSLAALFITGKDLSNPFKPKRVGKKKKFIGKERPEYFRLFKKHRKPRLNERPANRNRFRIQFETDAVDDYFDRELDPGMFALYCNGTEVSDSDLNLRDGVATLNISLPADATAGNHLSYSALVTDNLLFAPIENEFEVVVTEPETSSSGGNGRRKPPAGDDDGDREIPDNMATPPVIEVREDEWEKYNFCAETALNVKGAGNDGYDFFINMDNQHLNWELKEWLARDKEPELLQSRFKYSMVLIGMALLKEAAKDQDSYFAAHDMIPEKLIADLTTMIAPVILPMIHTLGELEVE